MRITDLQLHNFKFFTESDNTLKLDGKNVLIWGENGSGKSSIYWAIYTLLQCSFKDAKGIDDYFTAGHDKNLINIYRSADDTTSFVEMKLDNGSTYKIELGNPGIVGNTDIQLSAVSSDFIDYNVIAVMLRFWHKDDPVLFGLFEESIFRYLQFAPPAPYKFQFFDLAWNKLSKEFVKDSTTKRYPNKQSTTVKNKANLKNEFNVQLKTLLANTTTRANELLKDKFGYDIEIELEYQEYDFEIHARNTDVRYTQPEISLKIRKYYGKENVVKKPHSFLNEAKKTAIGLAIRLGLLERRLLDDKLNLLALDDLLISLDMSNRDVVLDLLFDEYQENYQLIIFTHDKQFFQIAKHKIEYRTFKDDWLFWEFYVNEKDPKKPKPKWFPTKSQLAIAHGHLQENDYPAAANYLRKHCEELLEKYMPQYCFANCEKEESFTNHSLDSVINQSILFLERINQTKAVQILSSLKQYVKILLNPLSHTERGIQRHKIEIKAVIQILENLESELKTIKYSKPILAKGESIFLNLKKNNNTSYTIESILLQDLFVYTAAGTAKLSKCKISSQRIKEFENATEKEDKQFTYYPKRDIETAYKEIATDENFQIAHIADWEKLYSFSDGTILTAKMTIE